MRLWIIFSAALVVLTLGCDSKSQGNSSSENRHKLRSGFEEKVHSSSSEAGFESKVMRRYLYYNDGLVHGPVGYYDISPSGHNVIYQDAVSGRLYVFAVHGKRISPLGDKFIGNPRACEWNEGKGSVSVEISVTNEKHVFAIDNN